MKRTAFIPSEQDISNSLSLQEAYLGEDIGKHCSDVRVITVEGRQHICCRSTTTVGICPHCGMETHKCRRNPELAPLRKAK